MYFVPSDAPPLEGVHFQPKGGLSTVYMDVGMLEFRGNSFSLLRCKGNWFREYLRIIQAYILPLSAYPRATQCIIWVQILEDGQDQFIR